jgi:chromosome segregation ATPase
MIGSAVDEEQLCRHLDEAHRQLLERDNAYRFHEEELRSRDLQIESRDVQIEELRQELNRLRAWASELEGSVRALERTIREMEATTAWRVSNRLRLLKESARGVARRDPGP